MQKIKFKRVCALVRIATAPRYVASVASCFVNSHLIADSGGAMMVTPAVPHSAMSVAETLAVRPTPPSSSSSSSRSLSFLPLSNAMIKLWPSVLEQLTPRVNADGRERPNPFDVPSEVANATSLSSSSPYSRGPPPPLPPPQASDSQIQTFGAVHHHLLATTPAVIPVQADVTPPGLITPQSGPFAARIPTTQISLHAPDFSMRNIQKSPRPSDSMENKSSTPSSSSPSTRTSSSTTVGAAHTAQSPAPSATSKGQIHVKLISARGLNVSSIHARPYVVVLFEQNEFVSRDPTEETDKEVKGTATALSRTSSSNALTALSAIGVSRPPGKSSTNTSPSSSLSVPSKIPSPTHPSTQGLFGRVSAHNPVWKHEVSL